MSTVLGALLVLAVFGVATLLAGSVLIIWALATDDGVVADDEHFGI